MNLARILQTGKEQTLQRRTRPSKFQILRSYGNANVAVAVTFTSMGQADFARGSVDTNKVRQVMAVAAVMLTSSRQLRIISSLAMRLKSAVVSE
jgi:hypothetical protein